MVLTEPTDWIGGQLTSQAVPPDEHPWIEQFGCLGLVPAAAAGNPRLLSAALSLDGRGSLRTSGSTPATAAVSQLCHEPRAALAALTGIACAVCFQRPAADSARARADRGRNCQGDRVQAVTVRDRQNRSTSGRCTPPTSSTRPSWAILLPLAGVEFVTGAEGQAEHGEPHAPADANPDNQQAFTCCFAVEYRGWAGPHDRAPGRVWLLARFRARRSSPPGRVDCST